MARLASQKQLELLAAFGLFEGRDYTHEEVSLLLDQAQKKKKNTPDWNLTSSHQIKIYQILKKRDQKELKRLKALVARSDQSPEALEDLRGEISDMEETVAFWDEDIQEFRSDQREAKIDLKERARDILDDMSALGALKDLTKKPTQGEMVQVIEALDNWKRDWEMDRKATNYVVNTLRENFKHLRTKAPRPSSGSKGKGSKSRKKGCGCWLLVLVIIFIIFLLLAYPS